MTETRVTRSTLEQAGFRVVTRDRANCAVVAVLQERPDLVLYANDKRHPSLAGTYLAAATVYAALFKTSPAGLKYTAGLDEPTAKFLQNVAWETVQDYFRTVQTVAK